MNVRLREEADWVGIEVLQGSLGEGKLHLNLPHQGQGCELDERFHALFDWERHTRERRRERERGQSGERRTVRECSNSNRKRGGKIA